MMTQSDIKKAALRREELAKAPTYIQALIDGMRTWTGNFHYPHTLKVSFQVPTTPIVDIEVSHFKAMVDDKLSETKRVLESWAEVAAIKLEINEESPDIYIMEAEYKPEFVESESASTRRVPVASRLSTEKAYVHFNRARMAQWEAQGEWARIVWVKLHEIGHALGGLEHGFRVEGNYRAHILPVAEHSTSYSVMSYNHTYEGETVFAITPMPYDIAAMQFIYGKNLTTNLGDTLYDLLTRIGKQTHFKTISAIWDAGGTDTLSAKGYKEKATLNLNEGTPELSKIGNAYVALAFGANIENVIGGDSTNSIKLNKLDNIADVRHSSGKSSIVTTPRQSGRDVILGFKAGQDEIIIIPAVGKNRLSVRPIPTQIEKITFLNETITACDGILFKFTEDSSFFIAGLMPDQLKNLHFSVNNGTQIKCIQAQVDSTYSCELEFTSVPPIIEQLQFSSSSSEPLKNVCDEYGNCNAETVPSNSKLAAKDFTAEESAKQQAAKKLPTEISDMADSVFARLPSALYQAFKTATLSIGVNALITFISSFTESKLKEEYNCTDTQIKIIKVLMRIVMLYYSGLTLASGTVFTVHSLLEYKQVSSGKTLLTTTLVSLGANLLNLDQTAVALVEKLTTREASTTISDLAQSLGNFLTAPQTSISSMGQSVIATVTDLSPADVSAKVLEVGATISGMILGSKIGFWAKEKFNAAIQYDSKQSVEEIEIIKIEGIQRIEENGAEEREDVELLAVR